MYLSMNLEIAIHHEYLSMKLVNNKQGTEQLLFHENQKLIQKLVLGNNNYFEI